jgi:hypothetical protein
MEVTGKIRAIIPAQSGVSQRTGNTWMSQEYVMDYFWWPNQTQPSQMLFKVFSEDRIKQWNLQLNDEVKITFHIEAHEYDGRWFNEVRCTNVQKVGASAQQPAQTETTAQQQQNAPSAPENNEQADDLPF